MITYMKITWPKTKHGKVKSELTSWNAYQKLVESDHWEGIVMQLSKKYKGRFKQKFIDQMLGESNTYRKSFYKNVVRRKGKDGLINWLFTKKEDYTHRLKR